MKKLKFNKSFVADLSKIDGMNKVKGGYVTQIKHQSEEPSPDPSILITAWNPGCDQTSSQMCPTLGC